MTLGSLLLLTADLLATGPLWAGVNDPDCQQDATIAVADTVDNAAPSLSVVSPANNATVAGVVNLTPSASDNLGVTKVEFYIDNVWLRTVGSSPFVFSWNSASVPSAA